MLKMWAKFRLWMNGYCFRHRRWPTRSVVTTREHLRQYDAGEHIGPPYAPLDTYYMTSFCPECVVEDREQNRTGIADNWRRLQELEKIANSKNSGR